MGVPCSACGRQYDVALFQFGRTIRCTCGRKVGLGPRLRVLGDAWRERFFADTMLGGLAKWLRILGFDTAYQTEIADADLVRRALEEQRTILTRQRALADQWRVDAIYVVEAERPLDQVRELVAAMQLRRQCRPFTRCSRCNSKLVEATRDNVTGAVPADVVARQQFFRRCSGCGRLYWEGSHTERMRLALERIFS